MQRYQPKATGTWEDYSWDPETEITTLTYEDGTVTQHPAPLAVEPSDYWKALKIWCAAHPWRPNCG